MADQRRLHPRLTATDLDTEPFIPELSPVVTPYGDSLMTRPWLDWARRLTLLVGVKGTGGGGGTGTGDVVGPAGATPDAIALYSGSTGKLIKDSLKSIASVINDAVTQAIAAILPGGKLPVTNLPLHKTTHQAGGVDAVDVKLLAGYPANNTVFLNGTGGFTTPVAGVPGPHHATHEPGGGDPMAVDAAAATGSLRTLGTGSQQAAAGNDARFTNARTPTAHATTHSAAGSDPVTVTNLAGYPGGTTNFLRADGSFAAPPGGGGGAPVGAQYWVSTVDATLTAERSLGALASGYVKSTVAAAVSTPSTVASIPAADGGTGVTTGLTVLDAGNLASGTVPAARLTAANLPVHHTMHEVGGSDVLVNAAWTNQANIFTQNQAIALNYASLKLTHPSAPANQRSWQVTTDGNSLQLQALDDSGAVTTFALASYRSGNASIANDLSVSGSGGNVACKDQPNVFTNNNIFAKAQPQIGINDLSQPTDARVFNILCSGGALSFRALNDAQTTTQATTLILDRSGSAFIGQNISEKGRPVPLGHWQNTPFNASHYQGTGGMTWTVVAGNVATNRYALVGKTIHWVISIDSTTLGGTASTTLQIVLPGSFTLAATMLGGSGFGFLGGWQPIMIQANAGNAYVSVFMQNAGTFPLGSPVYIQFTLTLEIQ